MTLEDFGVTVDDGSDDDVEERRQQAPDCDECGVKGQTLYHFRGKSVCRTCKRGLELTE